MEEALDKNVTDVMASSFFFVKRKAENELKNDLEFQRKLLKHSEKFRNRKIAKKIVNELDSEDEEEKQLGLILEEKHTHSRTNLSEAQKSLLVKDGSKVFENELIKQDLKLNEQALPSDNIVIRIEGK